MILCRNGHENVDGATYCVVCKVYIDSTVEPPPPPPPPPVLPTVLALMPELVGAKPGGEAACEVRVSNPGAAGEFAVEVLGPASTLAAVEPRILSLPEGGSASVRVTFTLPPASPAGALPFELRVVSSGDPGVGSAVAGTLEVAAPEAQPALAAELQPPTCEGRMSARAIVALRNPSSTPARARLGARDPEGFLAFDIDPDELTVEPNGAASAELHVRARRRRLVRGARHRPFEVLVVPAGGAPVSVTGAFLQKRYLPLVLVPVAGVMALVVGLAALLVLLIIVLILWGLLIGF